MSKIREEEQDDDEEEQEEEDKDTVGFEYEKGSVGSSGSRSSSRLRRWNLVCSMGLSIVLIYTLFGSGTTPYSNSRKRNELHLDGHYSTDDEDKDTVGDPQSETGNFHVHMENDTATLEEIEQRKKYATEMLPVYGQPRSTETLPVAVRYGMEYDPPIDIFNNHSLQDGSSSTPSLTQKTSDGVADNKMNILFIKIPKAGGTTVSVTIERYIVSKGMKVAHPGTFSLRTCGGKHGALSAWEDMCRRNHWSFDAWVTHSCFHSFMLAKVMPRPWKRPQNQLVLSLLREPYSATVSMYRYIQYRCIYRPDINFQPRFCNKPFGHYLAVTCRRRLDCSYQAHYLTGTRIGRYLTKTRAQQFLNLYHLVMITERFEESLVVLHMKFGFPWSTIPYVHANHDTSVPYPVVPDKVKRSLYKGNLQPDQMLYNTANERLDEHIESIGKEKFYPTLHLLRETNQRIAAYCKPQYKDPHDCVVNKDDYLQHGVGCFHKCIERVTAQVVKEKKRTWHSLLQE